jgi:sulfite exporter TauE/SafE
MDYVVGIIGLGFVVGIRHAFEADHVVAVSNLVTETKRAFRAASLGAIWGVGHTITILLLGAIVLLLNFKIPESLSLFSEFMVGAMLVGLGLTTILKLRRRSMHFHSHRHGEVQHAHLHTHESDARHEHSHAKRTGLKAFTVGMLHGMAGSSALLILVLGTIDSQAQGMFYILSFGLGLVAGMFSISLAMALPLIWTSKQLAPIYQALTVLAGIASVYVGVNLMYEIGIVEGLFFDAR